MMSRNTVLVLMYHRHKHLDLIYQTTLFEVSLFGFICAAAWVFVCYCVVPNYEGVVTIYNM
jgi:hypothetical protein